MADFNRTSAATARGVAELLPLLLPYLQQWSEQIDSFRQAPPTPQATCDFEKKRLRRYANSAAPCSNTSTTVSNRSVGRIVHCDCG
jgi:hypothetical protein